MFHRCPQCKVLWREDEFNQCCPNCHAQEYYHRAGHCGICDEELEDLTAHVLSPEHVAAYYTYRLMRVPIWAQPKRNHK
jgi:hypothetical protein